MKYFVLIVLMFFMGGMVEAQGLIYYQDSAATDTLKIVPVSDVTPLPITGTLTIGSVTVDAGAPPTKNLKTVVYATGVATNVASIANRDSIGIFNTCSTCNLWIEFDASVASATVGTSIPVPPYGFVGVRLDSAKVMSVIASEAVTGIVYQDGY